MPVLSYVCCGWSSSPKGRTAKLHVFKLRGKYGRDLIRVQEIRVPQRLLHRFGFHQTEENGRLSRQSLRFKTYVGLVGPHAVATTRGQLRYRDQWQC